MALGVDPHCDYSKILINQECPSSVGIDWEAYGEDLYRARGMLFAGRKDLSVKAVAELLEYITGRGHFHYGFECPLATASTFFTLAQYMASEGRMRRAQALTMMGFVFVRDKGFHDCTPWPIQGWDVLLAGRHVREYVERLDAAAAVSVHPGSRFFQSVGIVSVCAYAENEPVRILAEENHRLYADLHGYKLMQFDHRIPPHKKARMDVQDRKPFFWKVNAIRNALDDYELEWIIWMDCDAFFMDPKRTLDSVITRYAHPTEPALNGVPTDLLIAVDSTGINNGVFMMRNSDWSKDFLERWWNSDILQGAGASHNCSDQSTMQYELLYDSGSDRFPILDRIWTPESAAYDAQEAPIWPTNVRVVPQKDIQSFHQATAQAVLSREWVEGDFIKHHPGCHYYKKPCQWLYAEAANWFKRKVEEWVEESKQVDKFVLADKISTASPLCPSCGEL